MPGGMHGKAEEGSSVPKLNGFNTLVSLHAPTVWTQSGLSLVGGEGSDVHKVSSVANVFVQMT